MVGVYLLADRQKEWTLVVTILLNDFYVLLFVAKCKYFIVLLLNNMKVYIVSFLILYAIDIPSIHKKINFSDWISGSNTVTTV